MASGQADLSMVETLQLWNEAVSLTEKGNYEQALERFLSLEETDSAGLIITSARNLFNIGQIYLSMGRTNMAAQAFQEALEKDNMLAVGHFVLGNANLRRNRYAEALKNFGDALYYLRSNRLIDYKQLGLKYKLYLCEILLNRGVTQAHMSNDNMAREDFLQALQSKVEPKHSVIEDVLVSWQRGRSMEPFMVPSNALFQPSKTKLEALVKKDYLGKSKVVASIQEFKLPDSPPPDKKTPSPSKDVPIQNGTQSSPPNSEFKFGRDRLLKDLRKKETRQSLKKVSQSRPPSKPLPMLPSRGTPSANIARHSISPLASPKEPSPVDRRQQPPRSPSPRKKFSDSGLRPNSISPPTILPPRKYSSGDQSRPPSKPLPPSPKELRHSAFSTPPASPGANRFRPIMPSSHVRNQNASLERTSEDDVTVTVQYIVTRTIKVDKRASSRQLSSAAAATLNVPQSAFTMWYNKNNNLHSIENQNLEDLGSAANNNSLSIYCYEKTE